MEKLTIDRSKWYRGRVEGSKLLRSEDGCMCCLGFDLLRRGFTEDEIRDVALPEEVTHPSADDFQDQLVKLDGLVYCSSPEDCGCEHAHIEPTDANNELVAANDHSQLNESEREATITQLFAEIGVAVEFVG